MRVLGAVAAGLVGVVLAGAVVGCRSRSRGGEGGVVKQPAAGTATPVDPATLGSVRGVVRFAGKAPAPVRIDTTMDPGCGFGGGGEVFSEQYAVKGERLGNVYVYVKHWKPASGGGMLPPQARSGPAAVLDQKGCVYTPHVIAIEAGDSVEFRNDDPTMHNVHVLPVEAGNAAVDISQGPKGAPQVRHFPAAEVMMPVRCNNHPWMQAFINVSATPWFAVTGPDGTFDLKGMPPGEYTIGAVQEKLGEQDVTVTVKAQTAATADFTFAMK